MTAAHGRTSAPVGGQLAANVMHFGRLLRGAGLPVGTDRIQLAQQALQLTGLQSRQDCHDTLAACFVDRAEHRELFDLAFDTFWQSQVQAGPQAAKTMGTALKSQGPANQEQPLNRRLAEALAAQSPAAAVAEPATRAPAMARLGWSAHERLQQMDFESMSSDEWQQARALLRQLGPLFEPLRTRRRVPAKGPGGQARVDGRDTLRAMARQAGDLSALRWSQHGETAAPLVVLTDISGSMRRYARMLLHFMHVLGDADHRMHSFVFGTRLTHTTRVLRHRDPDVALQQVAQTVRDWSGGTRIASCLHDFNQHWARRVAGGRCTVLLVSDGLEQGPPDDPQCQSLQFEMARLHKSCRRLIWLNPLLRFESFQPRAAGIRAMLPHVDLFLPAHNLQSLRQLAQVLSRDGARHGDAAPAAARGLNAQSPVILRSLTITA